MNRMMPWRDGYWNCSPLMISRGMKLYPTFPCLVTWNRLNSCQVCWPFSLLVINLIFSSAEPSSRVYPPTYMPIYSETISLIPSSSPLRVMKVILTNGHSITKFSNPPPHLSYPLCTQFLILFLFGEAASVRIRPGSETWSQIWKREFVGLYWLICKICRNPG